MEQEISKNETINRTERFFLKNCCLVLNFWSRLHIYMKMLIDTYLIVCQNAITNNMSPSEYTLVVSQFDSRKV